MCHGKSKCKGGVTISKPRKRKQNGKPYTFGSLFFSLFLDTANSFKGERNFIGA